MMRFKRKSFQILTVVMVFLLICPGNLSAKKKGAQLVIDKQDGQVIEGELLRVKDNTLLVMTSAAETGVTIDINEIIKIRIKKKPGAVKGALIGGLLVGGAGGGLVYMVVAADGLGGGTGWDDRLGGHAFGDTRSKASGICDPAFGGSYTNQDLRLDPCRSCHSHDRWASCGHCLACRGDRMQ